MPPGNLMLLFYGGFLALGGQPFNEPHFFSHKTDELILPPSGCTVAEMYCLRRALQRVALPPEYQINNAHPGSSVRQAGRLPEGLLYRLILSLLLGR